MFSSLMLMVLDQLMVFLVLVELLETGLVIGLKGFTHHIGEGEVLQTEVWGIFIGLKLAADLHFKKLKVESDSTSCCCQPYKFH